ncbi:hypothetical protein [Halomonas sp. 328]|uniref:hypothetical protein n=1 Tax=Halomonas sp. 328 TaxID=2776704 RepID=UPI0018A6EE1C|nr:hypothetical protein [Halomonas sp. 328]MBF8223943.1 hypothetical protein [Halomonas sp. 328]
MESPLTIIARDDERGEGILQGRGWSLPMVTIAYGVPVLVCFFLGGQQALGIALWPLNNFTLMLLAWSLIWGLFLLWSGRHGYYRDLYLFRPEDHLLIHLGSGRVEPLVGAEARRLVHEQNEMNWHLDVGRGYLGKLDRRAFREHPLWVPRSAKEVLLRPVDGGALALVLILVEPILLAALLAGESFVVFLSGHLWVAVAWLLVRGVDWWLQSQLPRCARRLLEETPAGVALNRG